MNNTFWRRIASSSATKNIFKQRVNNVASQQKHTLTDLQKSKGWAFESPNLSQYRTLRGAAVSIAARGVVVWNIVMLAFELIAYPYDLGTIATMEKVQ